MADLFTLVGTATLGFWAFCAWEEIEAGEADVFDHLIFAWHGVLTVLGLALLSNRYL